MNGNRERTSTVVVSECLHVGHNFLALKNFDKSKVVTVVVKAIHITMSRCHI